MTLWRLVAAVVVAGALGLVATLLVRDDGHTASDDGAADRQTASSDSAATRNPEPRKPTAPPSGAASASRIETTSSSYFGRPFETVEIAGRYRGVDDRAELRVQLREPDGWTTFPLPTVTQPSGEFRAYVEVGGPGRYQVRIVDPEEDRASTVLTLLIF
jgi:hypothetical protein